MEFRHLHLLDSDKVTYSEILDVEFEFGSWWERCILQHFMFHHKGMSNMFKARHVQSCSMPRSPRDLVYAKRIKKANHLEGSLWSCFGWASREDHLCLRRPIGFDLIRSEVGFYIPLYGFDVDATEELSLAVSDLVLPTRSWITYKELRMLATESQDCAKPNENNPDEIQRYSVTCAVCEFLTYFAYVSFGHLLMVGHISAVQEYFGRQASQAHISML